MKSEFKFDESIICPNDPTATPTRIAEYKDYYKIKYSICKEQNPKHIVEIGVRAGYSAWTFLQACPRAKYIGFDANNGTHGGQGGQDGSFFEWAKKILSGYNFELIELDTQRINNLNIGNVDFFHVDGDHSIRGVQHDLDLAIETLNDSGIILVDDITYINTVRTGVQNWLSQHSTTTVSKFVPSLRGEMIIRKKQ